MSRTVKMAVVLVAASSAVASAATAPFTKPARNLNRSALFAGDGAAIGTTLEAATSLSTGFESPFTIGTINGQQGWSVTTTGAAATPVTTLTIASFGGSQTLREARKSATGTTSGAAGTLYGAFSPVSPQAANSPATVGIDFYGNELGGADYLVIGQSPAQSALSFEVDFDYLGSIDVYDPAVDAANLTDTGATFTAGANHHLDVIFNPDPTTPTITYKVDGIVIYTQADLVLGTAIDQIVLANDNFATSNTKYGYFDNLAITGPAVTPEPTSIAAIGLAGLAAVRRRRA